MSLTEDPMDGVHRIFLQNTCAVDNFVEHCPSVKAPWRKLLGPSSM